MRLQWHKNAWEDYLYWQKTSKQNVQRINELIRDTLRHPYDGIGKPEPLRGDLQSFWSRRITQEHRLVYSVESMGDMFVLCVIACRHHY
jgi:toxin YoeB